MIERWKQSFHKIGEPFKERSPNLGVFGISGITNKNFLAGYNPDTQIFDKSKTGMDSRAGLSYCRVGDPQQIQLILNEGKAVTPRVSRDISGLISVSVEGAEREFRFDEIESILNATGYPMSYVEKATQNVNIEPLLMVFKIGNHRIKGVKYNADTRLTGRSNRFSSNTDYSNGFGYLLKPGLVLIEKVLKIQVLDKQPIPTYPKPFRLEDVSEKYM